MSSAVSSSNVPTTPILVTTPSADTKAPFNEHKRDDSTDDQRHLNKQNSNKTYTRGNSNKNKQLTRSHAMKESASPPRTPHSHSPSDMKSHSPTAPSVVTSADPNVEATSSQLLTAPTFALPQSESVGGKSQLDIEFPKLTPPKTKVGWSSSPPGSRNHNRKSVSSDTSSNNNSLSEDTSESHVNDKTSQQKTGSQIISSSSGNNQSQYGDKKHHSESECEQSSNISVDYQHDERERVIISPSRAQCRSPNVCQNDSNNNGAKPPNAATYMSVKGKPPLKNMGSSSSCEGGNTSSGFISRDSSSEQFVDQNGIDLVQFFKETLNKNAKDRNMLMKIERDLIQLAVDQTGRTFIKFPPMSSYNRMLVHRTAAYFGMDHNVDSTQQCVIASVTKETRLPDIRFKTLIRDTFSEEPRKSILKREAHSFEDYRQGGLLSVHRGILNRKAKSFEERDEEYDKVRRRIFRNREMFGGYESVDEQEWQWMQQERNDNGGDLSKNLKVPNRLMKMHTSSMDRYERNPSVPKSHSFGGYGGPNNTLMREDSISSSKSTGSKLHKQDSSTSTTWRLSPSSSGYKTQSLRSDSVTPSPTGYGSDTPEPSSQSPDRGVVWAVTDLASVPKGSLIIDPQTLQPILNQDGSLYHFDPSNPPTKAGRYSNSGSSRKKIDRQKSLNSSGKPNYRETTNNNTNNSGTSDSEKSVVLTNNKQTLTHPEINTSSNDDDQIDLLPLEAAKSCEAIDEVCNTKEIEQCENLPSQIEVKTQSTYLSAEELLSPKQKNQSTSPNLPLNETIISEEEESVTPTSGIEPAVEEIANDEDVKKDDVVSTSTAATPPVQEIRFQSNPYVNSGNPLVTPALSVMGYPPPPTFAAPMEPSGTIYHTGPDGTLYVLSQQPVMYSYTTSTDNDVNWVPIFDQGALQSRDPNMATVMPVTYQQTAAPPYNGPTTLYQSPVVYSTDQFQNQQALASQVAQYPVSYPMSYATYPGAPYQNFWPQPMTYFLPQAAATPTPVLVPPGAPQTPNATMIQSAPANIHNPSTNSSGTGRRGSPPSAHHSNNASTQGSSIHTTAVPLQTFTSSVPLSLATSDNAPGSGHQALYAIPPSVYPNVLPYSGPTAGFYQSLPHHPPGNATIISSVIPHSSGHPTGTLPSTPHSYQSNAGHVQGGEIVTHFPFNHSGGHNSNSHNATSTPQSAPSTPLSMTTVQPSFKNPPLFATPPIISASSIPASVHIAHYDDKKPYGGYAPKKFHNNGSGILNTPSLPQNATKPSSNVNQRHTIGGYQGSTVSAQGKKNMNYNGNNINNGNSSNINSHTHSEDTNSLSNSNMSSNYNSNRIKNSSNRDQTSAGLAGVSYQPKSTYVSKGHQHQNNYSANNSGSNSNSPNSNDNSEGKQYVPSHQRGPTRAVPPSLDLKRNNSNTNVVTNNYHNHRSTPSTNSTESNNSPNSITSFDHSRSYHYSQYPTTSGGTHFYRGGSAGAINAGVQVSSNSSNNQGDAASIQTCFPFNVHSQNPGTSTPLLDSCHHQTLIGYNNPMAGGMYVKFGQAFTFANPLPNNRKSPSNDIRQPLPPLAGVYSTMNMVLPGGPRQMNPRSMQNNHNYKGNRAQR